MRYDRECPHCGGHGIRNGHSIDWHMFDSKPLIRAIKCGSCDGKGYIRAFNCPDCFGNGCRRCCYKGYIIVDPYKDAEIEKLRHERGELEVKIKEIDLKIEELSKDYEENEDGI